MALKNSDLRALLTTKLSALTVKQSNLSTALAKMIPQRLTLDEQRILNELGMTLSFDPAPDNPQLSQIRSAMDTIDYHSAKLKATLSVLPNDNKSIDVSKQDVMSWDLVEDVTLASIVK